MAAGDAKAGGFALIGVGDYISPLTVGAFARQSLVCYAAIVCGMCGVRFSVGCCDRSGPAWASPAGSRLASLVGIGGSALPVAVGEQRLRKVG